MIDLSKYKELREFAEGELTVKEAVIAKCVECCCFEVPEAHRCDNRECALFHFNQKWVPKQASPKREMTEEERAAAAERFRAVREKRMASKNCQN